MTFLNHSSFLLALALVLPANSRLNVSNDVNRPSVRDDVTHEDLVPRNEIYDRAVERGQAFLAQFSSNRYTAPITGGTLADSESQGWILTFIPTPRGYPPIDGTLKSVLQDLVGEVKNQYFEWRAEIRHDEERASFRNLYGPKDGVIAALDNLNTGVSLPMSHWSEISWRVWAKTCKSASVDPKTLKYIIRHKAVNIQTVNIIEEIYHKAFPDTTVGHQISLLPSGSTLQGFQALLGSPNGRGIAWMLLNKRNILGKTIAKITLEEEDDTYGISWNVWFELQQIAVAPPSGTTE